MNRNTTLVLIVILVILGLGWWMMSKSQRTATPQPQVTSEPVVSKTPAPESTTSAGMMEKLREIKVSGTDFAFTPDSITVKKGEKVKIVFQNDGKSPHDLRIDELELATKVTNPGQTDTVELTADEGGSFTMYCSVDAHRQKGMEGTFQVN